MVTYQIAIHFNVRSFDYYYERLKHLNPSDYATISIFIANFEQNEYQ